MNQPLSSKLAHEKITDSGQKVTHQRIVLETLLTLKKGTASDIAVRCRLDYVEVVRRLSDLTAAGKIEIASERGGRTTGGNPCRIYRAVTKEQPSTNQAEQLGLFNAA